MNAIKALFTRILGRKPEASQTAAISAPPAKTNNADLCRANNAARSKAARQRASTARELLAQRMHPNDVALKLGYKTVNTMRQAIYRYKEDA